MATAIFGLSVGFFTFGTLTVSPLGFTVAVPFTGKTALITAVCLSPPATSTDKENKIAPATTNTQ